MMNGDAEVCGAMTSGGTESIVMALKAYRDYTRAMRPEVSAPEMHVLHLSFSPLLVPLFRIG